MANLTVKIYSHEKKADGSWTFVPVDIDLDSRSTKQVPGAFKISWYQGGAKKFSAGHFPFLADAIRAGQEKRLELRDAMEGVAPAPTEPGRVRIDVAADTYLHRPELKKKRPGTIALATHDLHEWQKWNDANSKRVFVDQISNDDMLEYRNWVVTSGREAQTAVNKVMRVNHFITQTLKLQPGKGPITDAEARNIIVKKSANSVEYYSQKELDKFFAHCDARQHLLFSTFLWSGVRREELEYLYWDDLNFESARCTLGQRQNLISPQKRKRSGASCCRWI